MTDLWGPIDPTAWRSVPHVSGRAAAEQDVKEGRAVFYTLSGTTPHAMDLPRCALQVLEDGTQQQVVVVQAELGPDAVMVGVRPIDGGNGLCTLDELILLEDGFDASPSAVV